QRSPLFPYTTLFRSLAFRQRLHVVGQGLVADAALGEADHHPVARRGLQPAFDLLRALGAGEVEAQGEAAGGVGRRQLDVRNALRSEEHTSELQSREN